MVSFTPAQATDIRRHCGYPAIGNAATAFDNWRFYQAYGLLEYRIINLSDAEQAVVLNYLGTLAVLEAAIPNASATLDTEQASVWTRTRLNSPIGSVCSTTGDAASAPFSAFQRGLPSPHPRGL